MVSATAERVFIDTEVTDFGVSSPEFTDASMSQTMLA